MEFLWCCRIQNTGRFFTQGAGLRGDLQDAGRRVKAGKNKRPRSLFCHRFEKNFCRTWFENMCDNFKLLYVCLVLAPYNVVLLGIQGPSAGII